MRQVVMLYGPREGFRMMRAVRAALSLDSFGNEVSPTMSSKNGSAALAVVPMRPKVVITVRRNSSFLSESIALRAGTATLALGPS